MQRSAEKKIRVPQHQSRMGLEQKMHPHPVFDYPEKKGSDKLKNKIAFITGGDSGIGKAVEIAPSYLFLASSDACYMTGQFLHPNGGEIING